jgi:hypothetical protein
LGPSEESMSGSPQPGRRADWLRLVYAMPRRRRGERDIQLQTLSLGLHVILDGILITSRLSVTIIVFLLSHGSL